MVQSLLFIVTSCGWKKSCTTLPLWLVKPYKWYGINHLSTAGFLPSTISSHPYIKAPMSHVDLVAVAATSMSKRCTLRCFATWEPWPNVTNKKGLVRGSPYGMNMLRQRNAIGILWPHAAYSCHYITSIVLECRRYIRLMWDPVTTCSLLMLLQMLGQSRLDMFGNNHDK